MTRGDNERQDVTNQAISVAAKNAAFLVLASKYPDSGLVYSIGFTRALDGALEAAAPHMFREAKESAYDEGYEDGDRYNKNPYRSRA